MIQGIYRLRAQACVVFLALLVFSGWSHAEKQNPPAINVGSYATGFVVGPTLIITAYHAVVGQKKLLVAKEVGEPFRPARLIAFDEQLDVALIRANVPGVPIPLSDWASVPIGIEVFAVGFPSTGASRGKRRITSGILNGEQAFHGRSDWFQISAEIHRGNSGGPVIAADGSVIGMVTHKVDAMKASEKLKEFPQNVNFAIKSSLLIQFLRSAGVQPSVSFLDTKRLMRAHEVYRLVDDSVVMVVSGN